MKTLAIWTIYDHPSDYPHHYVARKWDGDAATDEILLDSDLNSLRGRLPDMLFQLSRFPEDDPTIIETWF